MQFTIGRNALQKELGFISGVVESKNTIPVLTNVLIESVGEEKIAITATDLDVTLRCETEAEEIAEGGTMVLPARKLFEIVRLAPDAVVTMKSEQNDWVTIKCAQAKFKVPGLPFESFPERPSASGEVISLPADVLRQFIARTIFAITQEESRYTLSGAKLLITKGSLIMVTTDGHRLSFCEKKDVAELAQAADILIPRKTLVALEKLLADLGAGSKLAFSMDPNHMLFDLGPRRLISRLLNGQFPNYEMVMPKGNENQVTVDAPSLNQAIRRTSLMSDDRSHALRLVISANQVALDSQTPEDGEASEAVPAEYAGQEIAIGFNSNYLRDFLDVVGSGKICFDLKDGNSQALLRPAETADFDYKYVVMPMRL